MDQRCTGSVSLFVLVWTSEDLRRQDGTRDNNRTWRESTCNQWREPGSDSCGSDPGPSQSPASRRETDDSHVQDQKSLVTVCQTESVNMADWLTDWLTVFIHSAVYNCVTARLWAAIYSSGKLCKCAATQTHTHTHTHKHTHTHTTNIV